MANCQFQNSICFWELNGQLTHVIWSTEQKWKYYTGLILWTSIVKSLPLYIYFSFFRILIQVLCYIYLEFMVETYLCNENTPDSRRTYQGVWKILSRRIMGEGVHGNSLQSTHNNNQQTVMKWFETIRRWIYISL